MIYRFITKSMFSKWGNSMVKILDNGNSLLFAKANGYPNPWYVHPVQNGVIDKNVILKPSEMRQRLKEFFGNK